MPPVDEDALDRRFAEWERRVGERFTGLESRFDRELGYVRETIAGLNVVHMGQYIAERESDRRRIAELEDSNKWLVRLVIGALVTSLVSGLMAIVLAGVVP